MLHKPAHKDTVNPPAQYVNLEMPLTKAVEAFKDEQIYWLRARVHELEKELKSVREKNIKLYIELEGRGKLYSPFDS
jgi:hypothetical protein